MSTKPQVPCTGGCGRQKNDNGQWWYLRSYYGFSGTICHECYEKISHTAFKEPRHPEEYTMMLLKQQRKETE